MASGIFSLIATDSFERSYEVLANLFQLVAIEKYAVALRTKVDVDSRIVRVFPFAHRNAITLRTYPGFGFLTVGRIVATVDFLGNFRRFRFQNGFPDHFFEVEKRPFAIRTPFVFVDRSPYGRHLR
ncbi:MAG: hypothetical protein QG650_1186 [Patescibacteria group bacterium]|nr:hypothetical protein [Patescibacteria group bacterium]